MTDANYPKWICGRCGPIRGRHCVPCSTFHVGDENDPTDACGWCGSRDALTQPRDFGRPILQPEDSARGHFIGLDRVTIESSESVPSDNVENRED